MHSKFDCIDARFTSWLGVDNIAKSSIEWYAVAVGPHFESSAVMGWIDQLHWCFDWIVFSRLFDESIGLKADNAFPGCAVCHFVAAHLLWQYVQTYFDCKVCVHFKSTLWFIAEWLTYFVVVISLKVYRWDGRCRCWNHCSFVYHGDLEWWVCLPNLKQWPNENNAQLRSSFLFCSIRGRLCSFSLFFRNIGTLFGMILGANVSYQHNAGICAFVPITFAAVFFMMPNTPRYYLERGQIQVR